MEKEKGKDVSKKMATLATPKKSSYIIKKDSAQKIIDSRTSKECIDMIQKNAELFREQNLKKEK